MKKAGLVALLSLVLVGVLAGVAVASPEARIAREINEFRHVHGARFLYRSWPLDRIAEDHSMSMGRNYRTRPYTALISIVDTARPGFLLRDTTRGWKSAFRSRLLNPKWDRIGVGVCRVYGFLWVTVIFRG